MDAMPIERLLGLVEDAITEAGVYVPDELGGATSAPRKHESATVARESTDNLFDFRDQDYARVEDVLTVAMFFEIRPKQHRRGRDAAHVTARKVRNSITRLGNVATRKTGPTYLSSEESTNGEWLTITDRFRFRRYAEIGREI